MSDDDTTRLLHLLADIRAAVGDPHGKLMQDELVEHCRKIREERLDALHMLALWLEWAKIHGHLEHAAGIADATRRMLFENNQCPPTQTR